MNIKTIILEIRRTGTRIWRIYNNNRGMHYHNNNGPAVERATGAKEWYINGLRHRLDGPAVEWSDGDKWWVINGTRYETELEYWITIQEYPHEYNTT